MKIKGIPCALKSPVAVRLVKKFLARYRQESLPQRPLRSSRQVWISCLPLRSLRLRGENAFVSFLFRVIPWQMYLLVSLFPSYSV